MHVIARHSCSHLRHRRSIQRALLAAALPWGCAHLHAANSGIASGGGYFTATAAVKSASFFTIEGNSAANGTHAEFGVLDFSTSAFGLGAGTVNGVQNNVLTLTLTQSNSSFSVSGPFAVYLTTNTTVAADNTSPLRYVSSSAGSAPYGIDPTLGAVDGSGVTGNSNTLYDLGMQTYTNAGIGNYMANTFTLTLSTAAASAFATELGGGDVRLVFAASDPATAATFVGAGTTFANEHPTLSFTPTYATAGNLYWEAGSATWSPTSGTNFDPTNGGPANTAWNNDGGHVAVFAANAGSTVAVDDGIQAAGVQFDVGGYTLNPSASTNVLTLTGVSPFIQVTNATDTATVNIVLGGTSGFSKTGAGTLVLGGTNTYTGTTTISGGTLQISADANLGAAGNAVALSGGTLQAVGTNSNPNVSLTRGVTGSGGIGVAAGSTLTIAGIFNAGTVTLPGGGTLSLTGGGNTLGGNGGDFGFTGLVFQTGGASLLTQDPGTGGANLGIVNLGAGGITASHASGTVSAAAIFQVAGTVPISVANATLSLSGLFTGAAVLAKTGAGTLVVNSDNSLLSGYSTATAPTPVSFRQGSAATNAASGGVVSIVSTTNPGSALGTGEFQANGGTISNDTGAAITLAISDISLGARDATGTPGGLIFAGSKPITVSGPISLYKGTTNAYQHAITVSTPTTFTGLLTASANATTSLGLTILGSSTLTLRGTAPNTMAEPVTIATSGPGAGVVAAADGAFAASSGITLNAGAQLTLNTGVTSGTVNTINDAALVSFLSNAGAFGKIVLTIGTGRETVGGLYLATADGQLPAGYLPAGTYGSSTSGAQFQDNTLFSGPGVIVNLGTAVPEPSAWAAVGGGLLGLAAMMGRRRAGRRA